MGKKRSSEQRARDRRKARQAVRLTLTEDEKQKDRENMRDSRAGMTVSQKELIR